ncbi:hypothetical protein ACFPM3_22915 [Streptomyces coeruleoprunus]|uniref:Uncharacterized protein n=2 Tax=Streptomyces coeruleoprunus TaxID=285563 RepID=A0ABV9XKZ2_9ACTN
MAIAMLAAGTAYATETNHWTMAYGNATVVADNYWWAQDVTITGQHYLPSGANKCRRLYATAFDAAGRVMRNADYSPIAASTSWQCSAGVRDVSLKIDTSVAGGPYAVQIEWQEKDSADTTYWTEIDAVRCMRDTYQCTRLTF